MAKFALSILLVASVASAQTRGPVVPNFEKPEAQGAAAPAKADEPIDLVGPTPAQQARAKAAAEALAKADADAKAAAEAKARAEAEARARAEAEARARAEAQAREAAAEKARAEEQAAARAKAEREAALLAQQQARAAAEAKARAEAESKERALAEARAAAKAAAEEAQRRAAEVAAAEERARSEAREAAQKAAEEKRAAAQKAAEEKRAAAQKAAEEKRAAAQRAAEEKRAAAQQALEEKKRAALEAAEAKLRARREVQAKAREKAEALAAARAKAKAEAAAQARLKALAQRRRDEESRCDRAATRAKALDCRAMVAARYDPPSIGLPAIVASPAGAPDALALAPLVAEPPERRVVAPGSAAASATTTAPATTAATPTAPATTATTTTTTTTTASQTATPATPATAATAAAEPKASPAAAPSRATASTPRALAALPAVARDDRSPARPASTRPLAMTAAPGAPSPLAIPSDEAPSRVRHAEVRNDLQVGPDLLILDRLTAQTEVVPESLQAGFVYRLALDDASVAHHLFGLSLESARCTDGAACGVRYALRAGYSPQASGAFGVQRRVANKLGQHTDELGWSATVFAGGLGYSGRTLSFLADTQVESLAVEYLRNRDLPNPTRVAGTLTQARLRGTVGATSGNFSATARIAGYAYFGEQRDQPSSLNAPMRGALIDDDLAGLAGAPQAFQARLEGRYDSAGGLSLALSYGYLSYTSPGWSSAHIGAANVSQRFGRFRLGLGLVLEDELDTRGSDYPTLFATATLGASF